MSFKIVCSSPEASFYIEVKHFKMVLKRGNPKDFKKRADINHILPDSSKELLGWLEFGEEEDLPGYVIEGEYTLSIDEGDTLTIDGKIIELK